MLSCCSPHLPQTASRLHLHFTCPYFQHCLHNFGIVINGYTFVSAHSRGTYIYSGCTSCSKVSIKTLVAFFLAFMNVASSTFDTLYSSCSSFLNVYIFYIVLMNIYQSLSLVIVSMSVYLTLNISDLLQTDYFLTLFFISLFDGK